MDDCFTQLFEKLILQLFEMDSTLIYYEALEAVYLAIVYTFGLDIQITFTTHIDNNKQLYAYIIKCRIIHVIT